MEFENLKLRKFDMSKMKEPSITIILGESESGKSILAKDIMNTKNIPTKIAISDKPLEYQSCPYVYNNYSSEFLDKIVKRQKIITSEFRKNCVELSKKMDLRMMLVVEGSMIDKNQLNKCKSQRDIFLNGRSAMITYIITHNDPTCFNPYLICNSDYVFLGKETNQFYLRKLYDTWFPLNFSFQDFNQIFEKYTKDYGFLIIDNRSRSSKLNDIIFQYKVNILKQHPKMSFELKEELVHLGNHFKFKPGGSGFKIAKNSFQQCQK